MSPRLSQVFTPEPLPPTALSGKRGSSTMSEAPRIVAIVTAPLFELPPMDGTVEDYFAVGSEIARQVRGRNGEVVRSAVQADPGSAGIGQSASQAFDLNWLRSESIPGGPGPGAPELRVVDLFAGCGGLSLGVWEAARALGLLMSPLLAVDTDARALAVYSENFPGVVAETTSVESLLDGGIGEQATRAEQSLRSRLGRVDMLIGGPPCQGHSDLNNHTRRSDPRNELYLRMARFCEIIRPTNLVIENVPGVLRDRSRAAQRTWAVLKSLGYRVSTGTINAADLGVAQSRKRNLTLASLEMEPNVSALCLEFAQESRTAAWAIGDLLGRYDPESPYDGAAIPEGETKRRIDYLFDNDLFDLPDAERPDCHRLKTHSYKSNYGRMHPDRPAQTITTGFGVMGKGRFIHPFERRTITPHEAARLQFFPDFFRFEEGGRVQLQKLIGNAVPPKLGYAIGLHLLR